MKSAKIINVSEAIQKTGNSISSDIHFGYPDGIFFPVFGILLIQLLQ